MTWAEKLSEKAFIKFRPSLTEKAKYIYLADYDSAILKKDKEINEIFHNGKINHVTDIIKITARAFQEQVADAKKRKAKKE